LHGLGTTVDLILVNGKLREGDTVIVPGSDGPIVTQIRGLLMPQPILMVKLMSRVVIGGLWQRKICILFPLCYLFTVECLNFAH
jgi:hypothetical protein